MKLRPQADRGGRRRGACQTPGAVMSLETVSNVLYCASDGTKRPLSVHTIYSIEQRAMAKIRAAFAQRN